MPVQLQTDRAARQAASTCWHDHLACSQNAPAMKQILESNAWRLPAQACLACMIGAHPGESGVSGEGVDDVRVRDATTCLGHCCSNLVASPTWHSGLQVTVSFIAAPGKHRPDELNVETS